MSITRSRTVISFNYKVQCNLIERVKKFNDFGVIFNEKFDFNDDINFRLAKARSTLGVIKRTASEFNNLTALRTLYVALVRSRLEYCSQIWAPFYTGPNNAIENIQKFLKIFKYW